MKKRIHTASTGKTAEVTAIVIGVVAALIISALLSVGLTSIIINGTVSEVTAGSYAFIIRTVASGVGCLIAAMLLNGKHLLIVTATALGYLAILVGMGIILYEGSFNNILSGVVSVLLGGAIACIAVLKPLKKSKHKVRYGR